MSAKREADFLPVAELAKRTGYGVGALYNQHSSGKGAVAPILCRLGGRVGAWRADYDAWVASQRRLRPQDAPRDAA